MFDKNHFRDVLIDYKQDFVSSQWPKEKYKWEAVNFFQKNWDVNAKNFAAMLTLSLSKTKNLLASRSHFPAKMIEAYAEKAPEKVRAMFIDLFDESQDVVTRISTFKDQSSSLHKKYGDSEKQHYQRENSISTYLWLRYPDKYYIYKLSEIKAVAEELVYDYQFKKGAFADNMRNFYSFSDELCAEIKKDEELVSLLKSQLSNDCYPDPEYRTLTIDVCFYISRNFAQNESATIIADDAPSIRKKSNGAESTRISDENPLTQEEKVDKYDKGKFLDEVYMTANRYDLLLSVLKNKKNLILQGAPGVGKTFSAKRLAYSMIGEKNESRIEFVQFHQNYSYEDFIMGYKPVIDGFKLKYGIFYRFCQKAANQPDKDFFFIIDEINRGNMSKIFGELLMLIERDYRGMKTTLAYNGKAFTVPKNIYIIGMMNTADRSLAMIDYALRRRFSFFEIEPGFDSAGFVKYQNYLNNETLNEIIKKVKELNKEIVNDKSLGKGFCIGHSYFCGQDNCSDEWMKSVIDYDILPMLGEYWFDDNEKLQRWENDLRGVFQ